MKMFPIVAFVLLFVSTQLSSQECNCDIVLDNLSSTTLNLVYGNSLGYVPGDTICIPSGTYAGLRFYNINGSEQEPVTIINCGGVVNIHELAYAGIEFQTSDYLRFSGSGDGSNFYGFNISHTGSYSMGIYVTNLTTDIEIDHIEISEAGFAGIMAKSDPDCNRPETWRRNGYILNNLKINNNYIHNTGGEGMYIGYTGGYLLNSNRSCNGDPIFGHWVENLDIHDNVLENIGWDGIQVNLVRENGHIRDNYIYNYGLEQVYYQNFAMSIGSGVYSVYNNHILNGPAKLGRGVQFINVNSGAKFFNNVVVEPKLHGLFMHNRYEFSDPDEGYYIANNTIINPEQSGFFYNTIITDTEDSTKLYTNQAGVPTHFVNNLVVNPGSDYAALGFWKQDQESYFDFNSIATRDSVAANIHHNVMTRNMDTLGLVDVLNNDFSLSSENSALYDVGVDVSLWGIDFDFNNEVRPSGMAFDIGAFEYQSVLINQNLVAKSQDSIVDLSLVLYPNPTSKSFSIDNIEETTSLMQIISNSGKILFDGTYTRGSSFDLVAYKSGIYFVKLYTNNSVYEARLIKTGRL